MAPRSQLSLCPIWRRRLARCGQCFADADTKSRGCCLRRADCGVNPLMDTSIID